MPSAPVASLVLLAAATGTLGVPAYLRSVLLEDGPLFLDDGPFLVAIDAGTCGGVVGVPVGSYHESPSTVVAP